jgi:hypothetical protein
MLNNCFNQKLKAENLGFMEYWLAFENKKHTTFRTQDLQRASD